MCNGVGNGGMVRPGFGGGRMTRPGFPSNGGNMGNFTPRPDPTRFGNVTPRPGLNAFLAPGSNFGGEIVPFDPANLINPSDNVQMPIRGAFRGMGFDQATKRGIRQAYRQGDVRGARDIFREAGGRGWGKARGIMDMNMASREPMGDPVLYRNSRKLIY